MPQGSCKKEVYVNSNLKLTKIIVKYGVQYLVLDTTCTTHYPYFNLLFVYKTLPKPYDFSNNGK